MANCYNLISCIGKQNNRLGLCSLQNFNEGDLVESDVNGETYTVKKATMTSFRSSDNGCVLGREFGLYPSMEIEFIITSIKVNGIEKVTTPITRLYNLSEYQPMNGTGEYDFDNSIHQSCTSSFTNGRYSNVGEFVFKDVFNNLGLEIRVEHYTSGATFNSEERTVFITNREDKVEIEFVKNGAYYYNYIIDYPNDNFEWSFNGGALVYSNSIDSGMEDGYVSNSNNDCPCEKEPILGENFTLLGQVQTCDSSERVKAYAIKVKLPEEVNPDRGFKECCYDNLVLANEDNNKKRENDFNSFFFKKQLQSDTCVFKLIKISTGNEYIINNNSYGQFWDFGDFTEQPNLTVARVEWKNVLINFGEGAYQIKKEITIAGISITQLSNTFNLRNFTNEIANGTIRIDCLMDGKLINLDVDFKGTGFETSVRTKGYFGNRNPTYKQDNIVKRDYTIEQISMSQENEYQYQTGLLPECITKEIYDFVLFGNKIFISDYNLANHSYNFNIFEVELKSNKGAKYYSKQRNARINLTFIDRIKSKRKLNC